MSRPGNAEMLRRLREQAVAAGLCQQCRCRPQKPGCKTCQHCLDATKARTGANRAAGLCECGKRPDAGHKTCAACRETNRKRWSQRRPELIAAGRCLLCRDAAKPGRTLCEEHLKQQAAKAQRRRAKRKAAGLCTRDGCRARPTGGHTICVKHRMELREYIAGRKAA